MTRTIGFLKHNAIALAALFIALGGTSYAAVAIPRNSVGARQLRKGAVRSTKIHSGAVSSGKIRSGAITPGKLSGKSFGGRILFLAEIETNGDVTGADPKGIKTAAWNADTGGQVIFPRQIPAGCFPLASAASPFTPVGGEAPSVGAGINSKTTVAVAVNSPVPVTLAIVCPR